jgi:Lon protease-like protein
MVGDMVPTVVVPVMTLGNCVFLPQQLMPLRIFEPRYRKMLKETLAGSRMFAISQLDEESLSPDDDEPPCPFTCVGRIVGHVELEDGTSHIILEGLRRAKVIKVKRKSPYPQLEIAPVVDEVSVDLVSSTRDIARVLALAENIVADLGEDAAPMMQRLRGLANQPGALADAAAGHLITDSSVRRELLECLSQDQRIKAVADELSRLDAQRKLDEQGGGEESRGLN